jgi:hypothetical protein
LDAVLVAVDLVLEGVADDNYCERSATTILSG